MSRVRSIPLAVAHYLCPHCMSWLFTRPDGMDSFVDVRWTLVDEPAWSTPFIETFTREKLSWATTREGASTFAVLQIAWKTSVFDPRWGWIVYFSPRPERPAQWHSPVLAPSPALARLPLHPRSPACPFTRARPLAPSPASPKALRPQGSRPTRPQ